METTRETGTPSLAKPLDIQLSKLPWWVILIIAGGIIGIWFILTDANYYETFLFLLASNTTDMLLKTSTPTNTINA